MIIYWEARAKSWGKRKGILLQRAYVELVGYDRSHEQPNGLFLNGNSLEFRLNHISDNVLLLLLARN
jgi:hypothetical protein